MKRPEDSTLTIGAGSVAENQPIFYYAPHKGWDKGTFRGFAKNKPPLPLQHNSGNHSGAKDPPNNADGRPVVVRNKEGESFDLAVRDVYIPLSESFAAAPPSDLLALPELHHSVLVHALRERHAQDLCYTFLGSLLVSLNPFSYTIPHYANSKIDDYLSKAPNPNVHDTTTAASTSFAGQKSLPPHPWSIAHRVFFDMRANRKNHSIIISGESGSGKTETCKVVLHYLCCLSSDLVGAQRPPHPQQQQQQQQPGGGGNAASSGSGTTSSTSGATATNTNITRLIEKVNASNPIMEAFGNAKTSRNDNSSRFGKLLEVQFSSSGEIGAMRISPFLLEKSRCVTAASDERVYHSFYQLVAGASDQMKTELKLNKPMRDFPMLSRGGSVQVQGVNDAKEFELTQNAFIAMGFAKEDRDFVWRIVAAVLHLSTVNFVGQQQQQQQSSSSSPPPPGSLSALSSNNSAASPSSPRGGMGGIASSARAMFEQAAVAAQQQQQQQQQQKSNNSNINCNNNTINGPIIKSSISTLKTDKEDPQANLPAHISPSSVATVEFVAEKLLKVDVAEFKRLLTISVSYLKNEEVVKILSRVKAAEQRDSICKYLYSSLFYWIIDKINAATNNNNNNNNNNNTNTNSVSSEFVAANSISILDIFGFEDFAAGNSLEQLCINLANEALQRHYSKHVFERDSEEISAEGVSCEMVKFVDNEPCLQLIMGSKNSLFSMLEDSSTLDLDRGNTDQNLKYLEKITQKHKPDYHTAKPAKSKSVMDRDLTELTTASDFFGRSKLDTDAFVVKHFASDVRYAVDGFVEKNTDSLKDAMKMLLMSSDDRTMQELLFVGSSQEVTALGVGGGFDAVVASPTLPKTAMTPRSPGGENKDNSGSNNTNNYNNSNGSTFFGPSRGSSNGGGKAPAGRSVGIVAQFRRSLVDLLSTLDNTHPNWIRCIRPHPKKAPRLFDPKSVLEQLMATGVLETITQRQRNFPFRLDISTFVHRFAVVCAGNASFKRMARSSLHEKCTAILTAASLGTRGGAQVGRSKVFLRTENLNKLERVRQDRVTIQATHIQKFATSFISRRTKRELEVGAASRRIKKWYRRFRLVKRLVKEFYEELSRKKKARDEAARQDLISLEAKERALVQTMEKSDRTPYSFKHREEITPLLKAATAHVVKVEPTFREKLTRLEYSERLQLCGDEKNERKLATQRQVDREEAEARALEQALDDLATEVNAHRKQVREDEKIARAEAEKYWRPIHSEIQKLAHRIRMFTDQRNDRIRKLHVEIENEKQRIKESEERRIANEARLWTSLGGKEQTRRDVENLVALGLSDDEVEQAMKKFFSSGVPSRMLLASRGNNTFSLQDNSGTLSSISSGNQVERGSLKNAYLERIRNATSGSGSSTRFPAASYSTSSSTSSSSLSSSSLPSSFSAAVTLDGYANKLRSDYEAAIRKGQLNVLPSDDKLEAAKNVILRSEQQQTHQLLRGGPPTTSSSSLSLLSALDTANISTKARDYAKYVQNLRQQRKSTNQQLQRQHVDASNFEADSDNDNKSHNHNRNNGNNNNHQGDDNNTNQYFFSRRNTSAPASNRTTVNVSLQEAESRSSSKFVWRRV